VKKSYGSVVTSLTVVEVDMFWDTKDCNEYHCEYLLQFEETVLRLRMFSEAAIHFFGCEVDGYSCEFCRKLRGLECEE
jgi:hypothetical protein